MADTQTQQQAKTTQDFIPIKEIRDGIVVLKDGTLLMVFMASSLNFALKSEDEQKAIIMQYQNFLNSLDFSVQIVVQSRKMDIGPYLDTLSGRMPSITNDLLRIQLKEYINFVRTFTEAANIMKKQFFVVVPFRPIAFQIAASGGVLSKISEFFGGKSKADLKKQELLSFEENRTQLEQRASVVSSGLSGCGVRNIALGTEELIELFYKIFNPEEKGAAPIIPK